MFIRKKTVNALVVIITLALASTPMAQATQSWSHIGSLATISSITGIIGIFTGLVPAVTLNLCDPYPRAEQSIEAALETATTNKKRALKELHALYDRLHEI